MSQNKTYKTRGILGRLNGALRNITLSAVVVAGAISLESIVSPVFVDRTIPTQVKNKEGTIITLEVPAYSLASLRPGLCSAYARRAAQELFGKQFSQNAAWNRRYHDKVVLSLDNTKTLEQATNESIIEPGMLVGVYNQNTSLKDQKDETGSPARYTHVILYLGISPKGEMLFAEQNGIHTRVITYPQLLENGLTPREALAPKQ